MNPHPKDLVEALGLPRFTVGGGYSYFAEDDEFSEGLSEDDVLRVG